MGHANNRGQVFDKRRGINSYFSSKMSSRNKRFLLDVDFVVPRLQAVIQPIVTSPTWPNHLFILGLCYLSSDLAVYSIVYSLSWTTFYGLTFYFFYLVLVIYIFVYGLKFLTNFVDSSSCQPHV